MAPYRLLQRASAARARLSPLQHRWFWVLFRVRSPNFWSVEFFCFLFFPLDRLAFCFCFPFWNSLKSSFDLALYDIYKWGGTVLFTHTSPHTPYSRIFPPIPINGPLLVYFSPVGESQLRFDPSLEPSLPPSATVLLLLQFLECSQFCSFLLDEMCV